MSRPALIPYKSHVRWVGTELIGNKDFLLLMVRTSPGERAVGFTQLRIRPDTAEVGEVFRDPARHQTVTAVAAVATIYFAFHHLKVRWLISYVVPSHAAAIEFNKAFGLREEDSDVPNMVKLRSNYDQHLSSELFRRVLERISKHMRVNVEGTPRPPR